MLKQTVTAAALLFCGSALAADNSILFNSLNARYIDSDIDGLSGDGYGLDLNVALTEYLFATVDYSTRTYDDSTGDADLEFVSGGLGVNFALNEARTLQLYAVATWEQIDLDVSNVVTGDNGDDGDAFCDSLLGGLLGGLLGACDTAAAGQTTSKALALPSNGRTDGYGLTGGIRALVMDNLELNAQYKFRDYDSDQETVYAAGLGYNFGNWVLLARYESYDELDIDEWSVGLGYTFGKDAGDSGSFW